MSIFGRGFFQPIPSSIRNLTPPTRSLCFSLFLLLSLTSFLFPFFPFYFSFETGSHSKTQTGLELTTPDIAQAGLQLELILQSLSPHTGRKSLSLIPVPHCSLSTSESQWSSVLASEALILSLAPHIHDFGGPVISAVQLKLKTVYCESRALEKNDSIWVWLDSCREQQDFPCTYYHFSCYHGRDLYK